MWEQHVFKRKCQDENSIQSKNKLVLMNKSPDNRGELHVDCACSLLVLLLYFLFLFMFIIIHSVLFIMREKVACM